MTTTPLPEGRKPMTDADMADLTRRLAGTAVDYKELYEAAKKDAEEAEAYAAELEDQLKNISTLWAKADAERQVLLGRIEGLEVKLTTFLRFLDDNYRHAFGETARQKILELYAELKGDNK